MLAREEIKGAVEAILFACVEPIDPGSIAKAVGISYQDAKLILEELRLEYNEGTRGIKIALSESGYSMCTREEYHEYIRKVNKPAAVRLSQAALETLAIIAYCQPVTRAEIEAIRGVRVDKVLNSLIGRGLVAEVGRKDVPGRPSMYGTTAEFLKLFGLTSLAQLPEITEGNEDVEISGRGDNDKSPTGEGNCQVYGEFRGPGGREDTQSQRKGGF